MQTIPVRTVDALSEELAESVLSCSEISARTHAYLARQHFELMAAYLDAGNKQLKALVEATSPSDFARRQTQAVSELVTVLKDQAQEILDIQKQARVELGLCLEDVIEATQPEPELAA